MSSNIRIKRICKLCCTEFVARTTTTQYCSLKCSRRAYKARLKEFKIEKSNNETIDFKNKPIEEIKTKEFLTVKDATKLLNCTRQTIFNIIKRGDLKAVNLSQRKTIIKRSEIDKLFEKYDASPAITEVKPESLVFEPSKCYNLTEVKAKYDISEKALHEVIKRNNIPKFRSGKYTFVPKKEIDKIFITQ